MLTGDPPTDALMNQLERLLVQHCREHNWLAVNIMVCHLLMLADVAQKIYMDHCSLTDEGKVSP